jgi:GTP:adenosylcobinamide-phosphate guanylyltransferase
MSQHVNTAMIMAAGKGTRMMPLTADRPKPLVAVAGTALLDHVLDHLRDASIGKIVINAHYRASQVEDHMAEHAADFEVAISDERDLLLDTGGGLVRALPLIQDDPFICVNADNWWTNDGENAFTRLMSAWDEDAMDVLMLLIPYAEANNTQGQGDCRAGSLISRRNMSGPESRCYPNASLSTRHPMCSLPMSFGIAPFRRGVATVWSIRACGSTSDIPTRSRQPRQN